MPNSKWDDDRIEDLLRDFPAIRDERPKEEVYNRLGGKKIAPKKPKRWLPYLIAALAFITFGALLTSVLSQNGSDSAQFEQSAENSVEDSAGRSTATEESSGAETAESEMAEERVPQEAAEESAGESEDLSAMQAEEPESLSVYPEDLEGNTLFTIGLTENAFVIPVSFLIPEEQVMEEFGEENPGPVALYNQYASEIDEEAFGFDDYHPYTGTLEATAGGVSHFLPADHSYDLASAAIGVYFQTMTETFKESGQIAVLDANGEAADFSQVGPVEPFAASVENVAYFAYTTAAGDTYVIPGYGTPYTSAAEAIRAMKISPNDFQQSLIPENMEFTVNETAETVEINFQKAVDFEALDEQTLKQLIEGLALTADSFGKNIQFNNTGTEQWDRFDFTGIIEAPEAVNRLDWNIK